MVRRYPSRKKIIGLEEIPIIPGTDAAPGRPETRHSSGGKAFQDDRRRHGGSSLEEDRMSILITLLVIVAVMALWRVLALL